MGIQIRPNWKGDGKTYLLSHSKGKRSAFLIGEDGPETERIARQRAAELRALQAARGKGVPDPLPIDRLLWDHLAEIERTVKPSTWLLKRSLIEHHLAPYFGSKCARTLTPRDLRKFVAAKVDEGASIDLARNCMALLCRALRCAQEEGRIDHFVGEGIYQHIKKMKRASASEVREIDSWTREEMELVLEAAREKEPRFYPALLCLFHTGMRRGEMLGLKWPDVDLKRRQVRIRRSITKGHIRTPKSGNARQVVITQELATELRRLQLERPFDDGWVFATIDGRNHIQETTFSRAWNRVRRVAKLRGARPLAVHCARHTFATLALQGGKSIKWVARQLGHADPALTLQVYSHVLPDEDNDLSFISLAPASGKRDQLKRVT